MHGSPRIDRADLVGRVLELGQSVGLVASAFGICAKTVRKWVRRFQAEGAAGLALPAVLAGIRYT